mgnify:CR=1 FL=1
MTVRTRAGLNSDADSALADNITRDITAEDVRERVKDLADSAFLAEDVQNAPSVGSALNAQIKPGYPYRRIS